MRPFFILNKWGHFPDPGEARAAAEGEELHAAAVARAGDVHAREADREAGRE